MEDSGDVHAGLAAVPVSGAVGGGVAAGAKPRPRSLKP